MKTSYNTSNDNDAMSINFIDKNPIVAIPYLTVISTFTLSGCVGNTMVIGAVLTYKVSVILMNGVKEDHIIVLIWTL